MRICVLLIVLLGFIEVKGSIQQEGDSTALLLENNAKIERFLRYRYRLRIQHDYNNFLQSAFKVYEYGLKNSISKYEALGELLIAGNYLHLHNYNEAIKYAEKSLDKFEVLKDTIGLLKSHEILVRSLYNSDDRKEECLAVIKRGVAISDAFGSVYFQHKGYSITGWYYYKSQDYKNAIAYFKKCLEDNLTPDVSASQNANIAQCYRKLSNIDSARYYAQLSIEENTNDNYRGVALRSVVYREDGAYEQAIALIEKNYKSYSHQEQLRLMFVKLECENQLQLTNQAKETLKEIRKLEKSIDQHRREELNATMLFTTKMDELLLESKMMNIRLVQKDEIIKEKSQKMWLLGIFMAVLAVLSVSLIALYKKRDLAYQKLVRISKESALPEPKVKSDPYDETFTEEKINQIEAGVKEFIDRQEMYLTPGLTVKDLAEKIGCSKRHLSMYINSKYHKTFIVFINEYRVKRACIELEKQPETRLTMDQIADLCGFNNRSTLSRVFRQITGVSPSYYVKSVAQQV